MKGKSKTWRRLLLILGLLLIAAFSASYYFRVRGEKTSDLLTAEVTVGDVEQIVLTTGKLKPKVFVNVGAQVSGQVNNLNVELGQKVSAGQLIAEIDAQPQQSALRFAEASVASLGAQRESRLAALHQSELNFHRQEVMLAGDATAQADYDLAKETLESTRSDIRALEAQIEAATTQVETARINLGYTRITAPIDGIVVAIVTKQGQTVNSFQSAPTIVMLAKLDVMTVRAEISEADVANVRPGQLVWFTTLGEPDRRYYGHIARIEPVPESTINELVASNLGNSPPGATPTAIYYDALFDVPNPEGTLRASMTVEVSVLLSKVGHAITVPSAALGEGDDHGLYSVRVVDQPGHAVTRKVRIGLNNNANAVVLAGLQPGERVVIGDASKVRGGDAASNPNLGIFGP